MKSTKRIVFTILLLVFSVNNFAQRLNDRPRLSKQEYLEKSSNQKQTAWILLGGGALAVAAGTAIFVENFDLWSDNNGAEIAGAALATGGGFAMVGSIFMFSASKNNHDRAMDMGFHLEKSIYANPIQGLHSACFPAIGIQLTLK